MDRDTLADVNSTSNAVWCCAATELETTLRGARWLETAAARFIASSSWSTQLSPEQIHPRPKIKEWIPTKLRAFSNTYG